MDSKSPYMPRSGSSNAPPLPPRQASNSSMPMSPYSDAPPPYESIAPQKDSLWTTQDPRSSSTQSLVPSESESQNSRRRLLMIYIHGFMGNETSFRSFPAHVHNLLTVLLTETHVVHTKIYPRYRSKKNISFARDDFSKWLEPHEGENTDVVLLGHSMGGLLSAEVVLMQPSAVGTWPLKHRILGTINFDVPFLGMHPGVVKSGLASIFKSDDGPGDQWSPETTAVDGTSDPISPVSSLGQSGRMDTLWQPEQQDPNFNPTFQNDVILPMRKGWKNALHFFNKHSNSFGELGKATKNLVTSHLEFGGAMANYTELKSRYGRIRALEEENEGVRKSTLRTNRAPARVRFVNYYTASTGRIHKSKNDKMRQGLSPSQNASRTSLAPSDAEMPARGRQRDQQENGVVRPSSARSKSPRISLEEHSHGGDVVAKEPDIPDSPDEEDWQEAAETLTIDDPQRPAKEKPESEMTHHEKEMLRLEKERQRMEAEGRRLRGEKSPERLTQTASSSEAKPTPAPQTAPPIPSNPPSSPSLSPSPSPSRSRSPTQEEAAKKPKKDRKFCTLPPKDSNGQRDPTWIRVFMENVDEVGAHCGLFFVDERYERLVGDVAERVEGWVREEGDAVAARGYGGGGGEKN